MKLVPGMTKGRACGRPPLQGHVVILCQTVRTALMHGWRVVQTIRDPSCPVNTGY